MSKLHDNNNPLETHEEPKTYNKQEHANVKKNLKDNISLLQKKLKEINQKKDIDDIIKLLSDKDLQSIRNTIQVALKTEIDQRDHASDSKRTKVGIFGFLFRKSFDVIKNDELLLEKEVRKFLNKIISFDFLMPSNVQKNISNEAKKYFENISKELQEKLAINDSSINIKELSKKLEDVNTFFESKIIEFTENNNQEFITHIDKLKEIFSSIDICKVPGDLAQGYSDYIKLLNSNTDAHPLATTSASESPSLASSTASNTDINSNMIAEKMSSIGDEPNNAAHNNAGHSEPEQHKTQAPIADPIRVSPRKKLINL